MQADANDTYLVESSRDGIAFSRLGEIPRLAGQHGLRSRALRLTPSPVRFLRVSSSSGDGRASISEVQAFCVDPGQLGAAPAGDRNAGRRGAGAPRLELERQLQPLVGAPPGAPRPGSTCSSIDSASGGANDMQPPRPPGRPKARGGRLRQGLFALVGLVSVLTYFNFGAFHFGNYVHAWDTFHYYVGAKYFRELGYERLYECVAVADAAEAGAAYGGGWRSGAHQSAHQRARVERRDPRRARALHRPLHPRALGGASGTTSPGSGAARPRRAGRELSTDHGYNATPVWNIAGSLLANLGPASDGLMLALTSLDLVYFGAMLAVAAWAFGWRPVAAALLVFATCFPCRFFWTGGAFLRWDWLFYTVAAVACLKRGRPWLGGLALGYAALLRIFPGLLAAGPALALAIAVVRGLRRDAGGSWRRRARARPARRTGAQPPALPGRRRARRGAAAAAGRGRRGWLRCLPRFVANTLKHKWTPLTNNMGLRTVLTWRPADVGRHLVSTPRPIPGCAGRRRASRPGSARSPWRGRSCSAYSCLLGLAVARHPEPWIAAALGTGHDRLRGRAHVVLLRLPLRARAALGALVVDRTAAARALRASRSSSRWRRCPACRPGATSSTPGSRSPRWWCCSCCCCASPFRGRCSTPPLALSKQGNRKVATPDPVGPRRNDYESLQTLHRRPSRGRSGFPEPACLGQRTRDRQVRPVERLVFKEAGVALVVVERSQGEDGAISVAYSSADVSATAGADYTAVSGTISWANGDGGNKTITVPIFNDATPEAGETLLDAVECHRWRDDRPHAQHRQRRHPRQ